MKFGAMRLRSVFDHHQFVPAGDVQNGIHIRGLAVKADREDSASALGDSGFDLPDVDVECTRIDIDLHRGRTCITDGGYSGKEGEWNGDDFVAWSDACCEQRQVQRAGSRIDPESVFDTAIRRELFFKCLGLFPQNELAASENARDGCIDFGFEFAILGGEINEGDHGANLIFAVCGGPSADPLARGRRARRPVDVQILS
jgi:hypothetical protein